MAVRLVPKLVAGAGFEPTIPQRGIMSLISPLLLNFGFFSKPWFSHDIYWRFSISNQNWNRLKHPEISRTKTNKTTNKFRCDFCHQIKKCPSN